MKAKAAQYKANASSNIGGGGSGNLNKDDKGANRTNLIGNIISDKILFQAIGEAAPGYVSPFRGKSLSSYPNNELEIN